jgi:hypothetical protein
MCRIPLVRRVGSDGYVRHAACRERREVDVVSGLGWGDACLSFNEEWMERLTAIA